MYSIEAASGSQINYSNNQGNINRQQADWTPYDDNGGTCIAVAGKDYCIVASATRLSTGYDILSRDHSNITKINDKCFIMSNGFQADIKTLHKNLQVKNVMYQHEHGKPMPCTAMSQLLSNTLYFRRFFPYYTFCICAGLDEKGVGCVNNYDVFGSHQRLGYSCIGHGQSLMQPVLDKQLKTGNPLLIPPKETISSLSLDEALDLVKDAFVAAGERDIYTGDSVEIYILDKDGVKKDSIELKKD